MTDRTEKSVSLTGSVQLEGKTRFKIKLDSNGNETVRPLGVYSMCPVLSAAKCVPSTR